MEKCLDGYLLHHLHWADGRIYASRSRVSIALMAAHESVRFHASSCWQHRRGTLSAFRSAAEKSQRTTETTDSRQSNAVRAVSAVVTGRYFPLSWLLCVASTFAACIFSNSHRVCIKYNNSEFAVDVDTGRHNPRWGNVVTHDNTQHNIHTGEQELYNAQCAADTAEIDKIFGTLSITVHYQLSR